MLKPVLDGREKRNLRLLKPRTKHVCKGQMTVALASKCEGGVCLYADRIILGTNGSISEVCKMWHRELTSNRAIAVVTATSDFDAAQTLAKRIVDGVAATTFNTIEEITNHVEGHLLAWSEPYHVGELALESYFLMATAVSGTVHLHFLQPRHTIVSVPHAKVIGIGEPVAQPIVDGLLLENVLVSPQVTLLRLAYAAKRAKERVVGRGGSNAVVLSTNGSIKPIREIDLKFAEDVTDGVAETANNLLQFMLALEPPEQAEKVAPQWGGFIAQTANLLSSHVKFMGLDPPE
jgi:hypothetical protein